MEVGPGIVAADDDLVVVDAGSGAGLSGQPFIHSSIEKLSVAAQLKSSLAGSSTPVVAPSKNWLSPTFPSSGVGQTCPVAQAASLPPMKSS